MQDPSTVCVKVEYKLPKTEGILQPFLLQKAKAGH